MGEQNEAVKTGETLKENSSIKKNGSSASVFWAGVLLGWLVFIAAAAGLGYYWYNTQNPQLQKMLKLQTYRLNEQLNKQSAAFQSLLDQLSEKQSARFDLMVDEAESKLSEEFDIRLARLVAVELEKLYSDKEREPIEMAALAFAQAQSLLSEGKVKDAGLYFSNAVQHDPDNWESVKDYADALIVWANSHADDVESAYAVEVLADLESYLPTRFVYLPPQYIEDAKALLGDASATRKKIDDRLTSANRQNREKQSLIAAGELKTLVESDAPTSREEIVIQLETVDDALANIESSFENEDSDYQKLAEAADRRRQELAHTLQLLSVLDQAQEHVQLSTKKSVPREIRLSHLVRAESMIGQIDISLADIPESLRSQVTEMSGDIDRKAQDISKEYSTELLTQLENQGEPYQVYIEGKMDPTIKSHLALQQLQDIYRKTTIAASQITNPAIAQSAAELLERIRKAMVVWEKEQHRRYNYWAVDEIQRFHKNNRDQLKAYVNTDEALLYRELLNKLGAVDTSQLNYAAALTYSEVFGLYYEKLDDEQKIKFTGEMAKKPKTPLDFF